MKMHSSADLVLFPLFKQRFWDVEGDPPTPDPLPQPSSSPIKPAGGGRVGPNLKVDLRTLPRDDGPPTELRSRKEKLSYYERQCSLVGEGLCVGAEVVAHNREVLKEAGITAVVNCVGFLYPAYFEDELDYLTLYLQGALLCPACMLGSAATALGLCDGWQSGDHTQNLNGCTAASPTPARHCRPPRSLTPSCTRRHPKRGPAMPHVRRL
jgi:hypothetical protein